MMNRRRLVEASLLSLTVVACRDETRSPPPPDETRASRRSIAVTGAAIEVSARPARGRRHSPGAGAGAWTGALKSCAAFSIKRDLRGPSSRGRLDAPRARCADSIRKVRMRMAALDAGREDRADPCRTGAPLLLPGVGRALDLGPTG